jgi:hypothetical protein
MGMVQPGGRAVVRHIPTASRKALHTNIRAHIDPSSLVFTDGWIAYRSITKYGYRHTWVTTQSNNTFSMA